MQFSLLDHTLAALLTCVRRAEVVQVLENLKGWSWLFIAVWPWCLEKWFRLTDLVVDHHHRGYLSVVGDDNPGIRV